MHRPDVAAVLQKASKFRSNVVRGFFSQIVAHGSWDRSNSEERGVMAIQIVMDQRGDSRRHSTPAT
ncbi:hypothetical protein ACVWYQ_002974 [Bradyrhizobium sp. USDA 3397]